jgi:hypothetical protein
MGIGLSSFREAAGGVSMNGKFREIVLHKDRETYVFRFDDVSHGALLSVLGRFADDPQLGFSWYDAAAVCKKVRQQFPTVVGAKKPAAATNRLG